MSCLINVAKSRRFLSFKGHRKRKSKMKKKLAAQSAFFNPRVLIGVVCLLGVLLALFAFHAVPGASAMAQGPEQNRKSGALHKVSVSDRQLVETLKSQGARVIADYGSFVLLEVNDEVASGLTNNRNAQIAGRKQPDPAQRRHD